MNTLGVGEKGYQGNLFQFLQKVFFHWCWWWKSWLSLLCNLQWVAGMRLWRCIIWFIFILIKPFSDPFLSGNLCCNLSSAHASIAGLQDIMNRTWWCVQSRQHCLKNVTQVLLLQKLSWSSFQSNQSGSSTWIQNRTNMLGHLINDPSASPSCTGRKKQTERKWWVLHATQTLHLIRPFMTGFSTGP